MAEHDQEGLETLPGVDVPFDVEEVDSTSEMLEDVPEGKPITEGSEEAVVEEEGQHQVPKQAEMKKQQKQKEKHAKEMSKIDAHASAPANLSTGPTSNSTFATVFSAGEPGNRSPEAKSVQLSPPSKPLIIGLYGISGSGKTYLLKSLRQTSLNQHLDFEDGSDLIDACFDLAVFKNLGAEEQNEKRADLMLKLVQDQSDLVKGIVIGGHLLLWDDGAKEPHSVGIEADWGAYTHIVYLQVDPEVVQKRRTNNKAKDRGLVSVEHLQQWQARERALLRDICYKRGIQFITITERASTPKEQVLCQLMTLLTNFLHSSEQASFAAVDSALESLVSQKADTLQMILVLDADKMLAAQDTGSLFWKLMNNRKGMPKDALELISKPQGYSYAYFHQVTLLYEEVADDFDYICMLVASQVELYPEMSALLARVASVPHAGAVIVTCELRQVWETVLRIAGLTHVKVISAGRLSDGYVVTDTVKGHAVEKLKAKNLRVVAFGDSPLDVKMLEKADEAYVIVGEKSARSVSMDHTLSRLIKSGHCARQILLPASVEPRLTADQLPTVTLDDTTLNAILKRRFVHATQKASAKLLMTAMRNVNVSGHSLRKAHERVGYYLANEYLGNVFGVESYSMKHVTDGLTDGYRFRGEEKTLIVPLMRGGEPMAFGVSKALRSASFVHSKVFTDIDPQHFETKETIVLVESMVNSGQSIMEYLKPLRKLCPRIKMVVVAGVVQAKAVENVGEGSFGQTLRKDADLTLVALRKSENKYTGKGATDTGHRLFNTTYLP